MKKYIINTDGASRGNPGLAAASFVIQGEDGVIWAEEGKVIGQATNNVAEYRAVVNALTKLVTDFSKHLPADIEVRSDSVLLANQLSGKFRMKNQRLKLFYDQVKDLEKRAGRVSYIYIPRGENFLADKLGNIALDNELDHG